AIAVVWLAVRCHGAAAALHSVPARRSSDLMHATKAAVEEGIVPSGGVALLKCSKVLDTLKVEGDQKVGVDIVRRAVEAPMRWIRSEEHTSELQSLEKLVCRLLLEKKKQFSL